MNDWSTATAVRLETITLALLSTFCGRVTIKKLYPLVLSNKGESGPIILSFTFAPFILSNCMAGKPLSTLEV